MKGELIIRKDSFNWPLALIKRFEPITWVKIISTIAALISTAYFFSDGSIIAYGDAESHLNIAKRVIHSLTPGFAQLGGIWLPLPHILLIPFVYFDWLWRTGLAGSIVSGISFIFASTYIFKIIRLITKNSLAAFFGSLVFIFNSNILYLQSTPMTELPLLVFFAISTYYFFRFIENDNDFLPLILAALFGFCASLSRYDGWALVLMEAAIIVIYYMPLRFKLLDWFRGRSFDLSFFKTLWGRLEGRLVLFGTLAFFGIFLWLIWGFLILGDPFYFTHSEFSANSQQQNWFTRGELPAYHDIWQSFLYFFITTIESGGVVLAVLSIIGLLMFIFDKTLRNRFLMLLIILVPFIFNVATLYLGQSVIFIPSLTPVSFEWTLFNVRYGVMMIPAIAILCGYLFHRIKLSGKVISYFLVLVQIGLFVIGFSPVLARDDGVFGLSSATNKIPDAQNWLNKNYDYGLVLTDDFARTISIIRTPIKMQNVIYVGNKPYWEESLVEPQKYARWVVIQNKDTLWKNIYEKPEVQARLFKYFNKVYTSEEILIFRKISDSAN